MSEEERLGLKSIVLHPIGIVRSPVKQITDDCWGDVISSIELDRTQFSPDCTLRLSEYSHVEVVFHLSQIADEKTVTGAWIGRMWAFLRSAPSTVPIELVLPYAVSKAWTA